MNTKRMLGVLLVVFLAGCGGQPLKFIPDMLMKINEMAGITMPNNALMPDPPDINTKKVNQQGFTWKEVRLQMDLKGNKKDVDSLCKLAERTLMANGVNVNPHAKYKMVVNEREGKWVGVEVLNSRKISVAEVTVPYKSPYNRAQLMVWAICNIVASQP